MRPKVFSHRSCEAQWLRPSNETFGAARRGAAVVAKRPDPPGEGDGSGLVICTGCAAQMSIDLLPENASAVSPVASTYSLRVVCGGATAICGRVGGPLMAFDKNQASELDRLIALRCEILALLGI